jgi:hypothetical protein
VHDEEDARVATSRGAVREEDRRVERCLHAGRTARAWIGCR